MFHAALTCFLWRQPWQLTALTVTYDVWRMTYAQTSSVMIEITSRGRTFHVFSNWIYSSKFYFPFISSLYTSKSLANHCLIHWKLVQKKLSTLPLPRCCRPSPQPFKISFGTESTKSSMPLLGFWTDTLVVLWKYHLMPWYCPQNIL